MANNATKSFPRPATVTIALFHPVTGNAISLSSAVCVEKGTTGTFTWDTDKLTTQPIGYQEYIYEMTDTITTKADILRLPQHELIDYIKAKEVFG